MQGSIKAHLSKAPWLILIAISGVWFFSQFVDLWNNSPFTDFDAMLRGANAIAAGYSPYNIPALQQSPFGPYYKYPPLFGILLEPLTQFSFRQAVQVWLLISLGLYLASLFVFARAEGLKDDKVPFLILASAYLTFQPTIDTLFGGQLEILLLFCFTLAYWASRQIPPRSFPFGVSIAFATLLKLYPIAFLPYLLVARAWKPAMWLVVSIAGLTLFSIAMAGGHLQQQYWLGVLPSQPGGTAWLENQSFFGFFARFFVSGTAVDPARATALPLATQLSTAAAIITFVLSLVTLYRVRQPHYAFVILLPEMLLIPPAAWIHYEAILLLPFGILLFEFWEKPTRLIPLAIAFALLAFGNETNLEDVGSGLVSSYKFCGVFLLWLIGIITAWHAKSNSSIPPNSI